MASLRDGGAEHMETVSSILVRRARPSDIDRIAAFVTKAYSRRQTITRADVLTHFGKAGLTIAECRGKLVGLIGWHAENLVVRVTDLLVSPAQLCREVTHTLLQTMEKAASELQCEVVILLIPFDDISEIEGFWRSYGYEPVQVAELPRAWREAALEVEPTEEHPVFIKKLREERVLRPM